MGGLTNRVAIVTGGGRGLGREHALLLAAEGAKVIVNDIGSTTQGRDADAVVDEIRSHGGDAVADYNDVSEWNAARDLILNTISTYGSLEVIVNNAGIHREGILDDLAEHAWDEVMKVNLRGHVAPLRWAASYWMAEHQAGRTRMASVINTTSLAGLASFGGPVQYSAAKAGVAQLTINASRQLADYGVRVNAIAPAALTPMIAQVAIRADHAAVLGGQSQPATFADVLASRSGDFDRFHPGNVSPLVAYLAREDSPETGQVYEVHGGHIGLFQPWHVVASISKDERWTVNELASRMHELDIPLVPPPSLL
jgi:NAD(P)-dependent dehydrogenase (short-subunit alcohol dehydrogenase family)